MFGEKPIDFQTIKSRQNLTGYKTDFVRPGHKYLKATSNFQLSSIS